MRRADTIPPIEEVAAVTQRLAVLLSAGVSPVSAWGYLLPAPDAAAPGAPRAAQQSAGLPPEQGRWVSSARREIRGKQESVPAADAAAVPVSVPITPRTADSKHAGTGTAPILRAAARAARINLRDFGARAPQMIGISLDETATRTDVVALWRLLWR